MQLHKLTKIEACHSPGFTTFLILVVLVLFSSCTSGWDIQNPYAEVDWQNYGRFKGHFHTHTTRSDGHMNPQEVVNEYHRLGYKILAITDHNEVTFPWTDFSRMEPSTTSINRIDQGFQPMPDNLVYEDRDPSLLGMIAIEANELSRHHHMGSFFNDHNGTSTEEESLVATAAKNGITMLYHPGRYNKPVEWYVDLYTRFDHLVGLEIYNLGDRYPEDRKLWDSILTIMMPDRPVWGFANDDMHEPPHLGRNWCVFLLPELSYTAARHGMEEGLFLFVHAPLGHDGPEVPLINSIIVGKNRGTIEIDATGYETIQWISAGKVVHEGSIVNLTDLEETYSYVRAKVYGAGNTVIGTQPFGLRKK